jgi:hypothetical protein
LNNLIGLKYGWGHKPGDGSGMTDCFQLACAARRHPGLRDHSDIYAWVYEHYDETTFTAQRLARFLLSSGTRTNDPEPGDVLLLPGGKRALGTVTSHGILYIGGGQQVVHLPALTLQAHYFRMDKA